METATRGAPAKVLSTQVVGTVTSDPTSSTKPVEVVGWDEQGPIATTDSELATQQPVPSLRFFGDRLTHLDTAGSPTDTIGGAGCVPVDELAAGTVLCTDSNWSHFSVRSQDGTVRWTPDYSASKAPRNGGSILSPDGQSIADFGVIMSQTAAAIQLPYPGNDYNSAMSPQGWVDDRTVIGRITQGPAAQLGLYQMGGSGAYEPLGIQGQFVGVLQTG
jgi:hypothetical protein